MAKELELDGYEKRVQEFIQKYKGKIVYCLFYSELFVRVKVIGRSEKLKTNIIVKVIQIPNWDKKFKFNIDSLQKDYKIGNKFDITIFSLFTKKQAKVITEKKIKILLEEETELNNKLNKITKRLEIVSEFQEKYLQEKNVQTQKDE